VEGEHFENGASQKRWLDDNHMAPLTELSLNTNPKKLVDVVFLNFPDIMWTETFDAFSV